MNIMQGAEELVGYDLREFPMECGLRQGDGRVQGKLQWSV